MVFTRNYQKRIDLDERLKRGDSIWNLDNEKKIFTKGCRYNFIEEDKEEERGDSKKKDDSEKGKMLLQDDEMVVKKIKYSKLIVKIDELEKHGGSSVGDDQIVVKKKEFNDTAKKIQDLEKHVEELEKDDDTEGKKRVIMHDGEMLIRTEHYKSMRDKCIQLEEEVKELKGEKGWS